MRSTYVGWSLAAAILIGGALFPLHAPVAGAQTAAAMPEIERLVRAKVDIGEAMGVYMREQGGSGRSGDDYTRMTEEINALVDKILASYGLTVQEYRARSAVVLADKAAVDAFLNQHPDLKARYKALPAPGSRGPGGGGH